MPHSVPEVGRGMAAYGGTSGDGREFLYVALPADIWQWPTSEDGTKVIGSVGMQNGFGRPFTLVVYSARDQSAVQGEWERFLLYAGLAAITWPLEVPNMYNGG